MDVTVNINAPAIVDALNKIAEVFGAAIAQNAAPAPGVTTPTQPLVVNANPPQPIQSTATAPIQPPQQVVPNIPQGIPNTAQSVQQPPQNVPQQPIDDNYRNRVINAAARLCETGQMPAVMEILHSYGVATVTALDATQLPEFAAKITALGAVI